jgi:rod shape-determining protein MreB
MIANLLSRFFTVHMGIDLGTANVLVYVENEGIVLRAPSVVAIRKSTGEVLAVGDEAKEMLGKTPEDIEAMRPLRDGVIADFSATERMLRYFIQKANRKTGLFRPRPVVVIGVPSGITEVERRAVIDAALKSGCREVELISEPMAAAIGADLPIQEPIGNMVVDIGGGTTEVAVISLGGIVVHESMRIAGDEMDQAIQEYAKKHFDMEISQSAAERLKIAIGSAAPVDEPLEPRKVRGFNVAKRLPDEVEMTPEDIRKALNGPVEAVIGIVLRTLERTRPELCDDLATRGIVLTGGGALLRGLDTRIQEATGIPVRVCDDPLTAVVRGTGKYVEYKAKRRNRLS